MANILPRAQADMLLYSKHTAMRCGHAQADTELLWHCIRLWYTSWDRCYTPDLM